MNAYNLFDEFLDGVFIFNEAKEILYCNEIAATIFGTRPKRVLGKKSFEIFKIQDDSLFCTEAGTLGKDDISHYIEVPYEGKDTKGLVQIMVKPCLIYPEQKHWLCYFHNMTEEQALSTKFHNETDEKHKAHEQATTDVMTGLKNFRGFNLKVAEEMKMAIERKENLGLVIIDVDKFKIFNDTYGHQQGDEVLKSVGQALQSSVRRNDFVARYGGEEFVMILPNTNLEGVIKVSEKVRMCIQMTQVPNINDLGTFLSVTASFGAICISSEFLLANQDKGYKFFLEYADKNLYKAKESGRNRSEASVLE